jgi:hypothetical protein
MTLHSGGGSRFVVLARPDDYQVSHDVVIGRRHTSGSLDVVETMTTRHVPASMLIGKPTLQGEDATEFLQAALDAAWKLGMRPTGHGGETEQVSAIKDHLHDLRAIVFNGRVEPKK